MEEKEEDETIGERGGVGSEGCRQAGGGGYINRKEGDETTDRWELGRDGKDSTAPAGGRSPPHRSGAEPRCTVHRMTGQDHRSACVRGVVSDGRAGRQVADAVGGGLGTAGYGDTRPPGSPLTHPTNSPVRPLVACVLPLRPWVGSQEKEKNPGRKKTLGARWWLALRLVWQGRGLGELSPVGVVRTRPSAFCPNGHGWPLRRNMFFFLFLKWN